MSPTTIEEQLRRYGQDLAARDDAGTLLIGGTTPGPVLVPQRGEAASDGVSEVMPPTYVSTPPVGIARRSRRNRTLAVAAIFAVVLTVVGAVAIDRRGHTTRDEITAPSATAPPTATAPVAAGPLGAYAVPPTDSSSVRGWVNGDAYAIQYTSGGHQFVVFRYAEGAPPTWEWTPEMIVQFLDGRGTATEVPSLGTVFVSCGDAASLTLDGEWDWWSAAVGFWLQDGHMMSLSLVGIGEQPPIGHDRNGTVFGSDSEPIACPATADAAILQNALAEMQTVGKADLDAALDSIPLSIGNLGRQIAEPRS
jgi:hypothetical protein